MDETRMCQSSVNQSSVNQSSVTCLSINRLSMNCLSINHLSFVCQSIICHLSVNQSSVNQLSVNQSSVHQSSVNQSFVTCLSINRMSINHLSINHLSINHLSGAVLKYCPGGSLRFDLSCYKLKSDGNATAKDAGATCRALGGDLVSIGSVAEDQFVRMYVARMSATSDFWIGQSATVGPLLLPFSFCVRKNRVFVRIKQFIYYFLLYSFFVEYSVERIIPKYHYRKITLPYNAIIHVSSP